ncbi:MAG: patatin-like phospholipase family protein, partial [Chitinophagia bacterium]|nr:patatin-like phospholipase family protein [Chitinophagia bacterium]
MCIHQQELMNNAKKEFPIYFVISDGGASRSAYWTASVLSVLEKKTNGGFSKNLFCLSGASGGSFGNMAFYGSIKNLKTNRLEHIQSYLSNDFLSFPLVRLLGPDLVIPFIPGLRSTDRASALEKSMEDVGGNDALSKFMKQDLSTMLEENTAFSPVIAINATRMQDGTPGLISNVKFENEISEKRIDILGLLDQNQSMNISTAVVLGARFPYFSPAGRIKDQYFVDGGYFDNSGGGIVHEMILDLQHLITDTLNLHPDHPYQKIRFHVIHISNQADGKNKIRKIHPLVNDLAAPIKTIMGSYASQTDFNNLRLYKYLLELYDGDTTYHTINLYQKGETDFF